MIIALVVCLAILAVLLFALYWKGDVKAGFNFFRLHSSSKHRSGETKQKQKSNLRGSKDIHMSGWSGEGNILNAMLGRCKSSRLFSASIAASRYSAILPAHPGK